ncbi:hypothetical protein ACFSVJ_17155 [Prauserella oleivorans]
MLRLASTQQAGRLLRRRGLTSHVGLPRLMDGDRGPRAGESEAGTTTFTPVMPSPMAAPTTMYRTALPPRSPKTLSNEVRDRSRELILLLSLYREGAVAPGPEQRRFGPDATASETWL